MKSYHFIIAILLISLCSGLTSCFKDTCRNKYTLYKPVYKSLTAIRSDMKNTPATPLEEVGKIYTYGHFLFVNEKNKGVHVIDNTNPSSPINASFIKIPGNYDIAVKGDYLYADSYSDLVVFDISNPSQIRPVHFTDNIFKEYAYYWAGKTSPDSVLMITDYITKDTVVDCDTYNRWQQCPYCQILVPNAGIFYSANANTKSGTGGSMARFTIQNDFLYAVSTSTLYAFNISTPSSPQQSSSNNLSWNIETIYPFKDKLFIGSTTGMYIFSIADAANPTFLSQTSHIRSCDPVVTDGDHAFVTLRSGTPCLGFTNELDVLDVSNATNPEMLKTYSMTNPFGLAKSGDLLFICDGKAGLKIYNASDVYNINEIKSIEILNPYDVIAENGLAIVVAASGIYELDYTNSNNIKVISHILIKS